MMTLRQLLERIAKEGYEMGLEHQDHPENSEDVKIVITSSILMEYMECLPNEVRELLGEYPK